MPRPCPHPDSKLPAFGESYVAGACRVCWHFVNTPTLRAQWTARPVPPPVPVRVEIPCRFLGDEISGHEKRTLLLGTFQRWARCAKGFTLNPRDVPGIVCPCRGCHSRCAGYVPEDQT